MPQRSRLAHQPVPTTIVWDESLMAYDFGPNHPMHPSRLDLSARLMKDFGIFDLSNVSTLHPEPVDDSVLLNIHDAEYIKKVKAVSADPELKFPAQGLGSEDIPTFPHMHEASARIVGGSVAAAGQIVSGQTVHALNFAGGMHHAMPASASGFCIYNDAAAAIDYMLSHGVQRVMYIDVDAHHGDGTEAMFWNDPRVLTFSIHETGKTLFPGTGFAADTGGPDAPGSAVNVPVPARTSDAAWLRALHALLAPIAKAFEPEVIVSQHGCDSHRDDPLTHMRLSLEAQRQAAATIDQLARTLCDGRWLAVGGGGYDVHSAVPRSWTHLAGLAAGEPIAATTPTPENWQRYVRETYSAEPAMIMGDEVDLWWRSWEAGYDPHQEIDRIVMAVRKETFPLLGLDPWFD